MSELTSNQYLIIIAVLVFISIVMLFSLSRSKRDTQELQQDLNKTIGDYNQLAERFDSLSAVKNQLEHDGAVLHPILFLNIGFFHHVHSGEFANLLHEIVL